MMSFKSTKAGANLSEHIGIDSEENIERTIDQRLIASYDFCGISVPGGTWDAQRERFVPPPLDDSLHHLPTVRIYRPVDVSCDNMVPSLDEIKRGLMSVDCGVNVLFGATVGFRPLSTKLLDRCSLVLRARTQAYVSDHGDIISGRTEGPDNMLYVKCQTRWPSNLGRAGEYQVFNITPEVANWKKNTADFKKRLKLSVHHCVIYTFEGGMPRMPEDNIDIFWSVDHINRDTTDNRIVNLRWATQFEQANNRSCCITAELDEEDCRPRCINSRPQSLYVGVTKSVDRGHGSDLTASTVPETGKMVS